MRRLYHYSRLQTAGFPLPVLLQRHRDDDEEEDKEEEEEEEADSHVEEISHSSARVLTSNSGKSPVRIVHYYHVA